MSFSRMRFFIELIFVICFVIAIVIKNPFAQFNSSKYDETKIDKIRFERICNDEDIYKIKFNENSETNTTKYKVRPAKPSLVEMPEKDIYPVFSLKCKYELTLNNPQVLSQPGFETSSEVTTKYLGIRLDPIYDDKGKVSKPGICPLNKESKQTKATYHNYKDTYSWYCTNPNFD